MLVRVSTLPSLRSVTLTLLLSFNTNSKSVASPFRITLSISAPPSIVSLPAPPLIISLPSPPLIVSSPPFVVILLLSLLPIIVSSPPPVAIFSILDKVSSPCPVTIPLSRFALILLFVA